MAKPSPKWKKFEAAVSAFISRLDPSAKVTPNASLPDRHTGSRRQRDVWIEAKACHHFPIAILVSCKRYGRRIHQGDIDTFHGELLSSRAQKGVLYSYSKFGKDAITKAKALGICCCRLYENQPADLPESLIVGTHYCCHAQIILGVGQNFSEWGITKWSELFEIATTGANGETTILDRIAEEFQQGENQEVTAMKERMPKNPFPQDWSAGLRIEDLADGKQPLEVAISGKWKFFIGKIEAILLDGSYSITNNEFIGTQTGPVIDTQGYTPGPSWEPLEERPIHTGESCSVCVRYRADRTVELVQTIAKAIGANPIVA